MFAQGEEIGSAELLQSLQHLPDWRVSVSVCVVQRRLSGFQLLAEQMDQQFQERSIRQNSQV